MSIPAPAGANLKSYSCFFPYSLTTIISKCLSSSLLKARTESRTRTVGSRFSPLSEWKINPHILLVSSAQKCKSLSNGIGNCFTLFTTSKPLICDRAPVSNLASISCDPRRTTPILHCNLSITDLIFILKTFLINIFCILWDLHILSKVWQPELNTMLYL